MADEPEKKSNAGRPRLWETRMNVTMTKRMKKRIELAVTAPETSLDLVRQAIESELKRRERTSPKPKP